MNVILISVDTVRPDHLSTYGYRTQTDPFLKEFAEESFIFQNMYTHIPQTYPSFAMLFTGRLPVSTGVYSNVLVTDDGELSMNYTTPINHGVPTLAKKLQDEGYSTAAFITSGVLHKDFTNLDEGFDTFNQFEVHDINEWKQDRKQYIDFIIKAKNWLAEHKKEKFFYWIHLMDPHSPYYPPEDQRCIYQDGESCLSLQKKSFEDLNSFKSRYYACTDQALPLETAMLYQNLYDAEIKIADNLFGEILQEIRDNQLDQNSLIVYYSDHGESFEHNYNFAHGEVLYESTVKIPFIMRHPFIKKQKTISTLTSNVDIAPTILDLLSVQYDKESIDGTSLKGLILSPYIFSKRAREEDNKAMYFTNYNVTKYAIRQGDYKYIYSLPHACLYKGQQEELYNIKIDPEEQQNLIGEEPYTTKELKTSLMNYISKYDIETIEVDRADNKLKQQLIDELKSLGY